MTLLILDFDGTMTDAEAEGGPYRQGYLQDLAILTGKSDDEIKTMALEFEQEVTSDQGRFGWVFSGQIVAPACVDPYLRVMPVARMILDASGTLPNPELRERILDGILYKYNYQKTKTVFRPGAYNLLSQLSPGGDVEAYVVTNSHTIPVQNKIQQLAAEGDNPHALDWLIARVFGSAKKYIIDESFDAVSQSINLPGLTRPILLRRRRYFDVIDSLRRQHGVAWEDVVVIGDIFELDLCLPFALGAHVGLMCGDFTPQYERVFLENHQRGTTFNDLFDVGRFLGLISESRA